MRDYVIWEYRLLAFNQALLNEGVDDAVRQQMVHNRALSLANSMAHSGHSPAEIHRFLDNHDAGHLQHFMNWYAYGGEHNAIKYVRGLASHVFNVHSDRPNLIDGRPLHPNLFSQRAKDDIAKTYANTQRELRHGGLITIHRGINVPDSNHQYVPNSVESWTQSAAEAHKMFTGGSRHLLLSAQIKPEHVLWSHLARTSNGFIPPEDDLLVRGEHVVFGNHLLNIQHTYEN